MIKHLEFSGQQAAKYSGQQLLPRQLGGRLVQDVEAAQAQLKGQCLHRARHEAVNGSECQPVELIHQRRERALQCRCVLRQLNPGRQPRKAASRVAAD